MKLTNLELILITQKRKKEMTTAQFSKDCIPWVKNKKQLNS